MKLYFVRHGETDHNLKQMFYGWTDCDINETGIAQAERLQNHFQHVAYDCIYSSDLLRAQHTARIIAGERAAEMTLVHELREVFFGDWEDTHPADMIKDKNLQSVNWSELWEGGHITNSESLEAFYARVSKAMEQIIQENKGKTVLIVAHGGTIRAALSYLVGAGSQGFWRFMVNQGCYTSAYVSGNRREIEHLNCPV